MAKQFLVSTVAAGTYTITDLGGRALTHPVVSLDLALEYTLEELRDSADLRALINAGDFTVVFDGASITTNALFDEYMVDFDHVDVKANTDAIAALTASDTWQFTFGENGNINGDRYLKTVGGSFSNVSPMIVPVACEIYAVAVKSEDGTSISYDMIIEDDGVTAHTESVTTADSAFTAGLSVAVAAGSEIAAKFDHTGDNGRDITTIVYFRAT
jgi:hypothetical protein